MTFAIYYTTNTLDMQRRLVAAECKQTAEAKARKDLPDGARIIDVELVD
jgi:hypothetical protein